MYNKRIIMSFLCVGVCGWFTSARCVFTLSLGLFALLAQEEDAALMDKLLHIVFLFFVCASSSEGEIVLSLCLSFIGVVDE